MMASAQRQNATPAPSPPNSALAHKEPARPNVLSPVRRSVYGSSLGDVSGWLSGSTGASLGDRSGWGSPWGAGRSGSPLSGRSSGRPPGNSGWRPGFAARTSIGLECMVSVPSAMGRSAAMARLDASTSVKVDLQKRKCGIALKGAGPEARSEFDVDRLSIGSALYRPQSLDASLPGKIDRVLQ